MKKLSLILLMIGYMFCSQEMNAQWVNKLNAKGEVRIVYEVPRLSQPATNSNAVPPPIERTVKTNTASNAGSNMVAVEYAYSEGFTVVEEHQGNGKWGFMRMQNARSLADPFGNFQDAKKFREGMAGIKLAGKWGFADRSMMVTITPAYDDISYFSEGLAGVSINKKYGFIDKTGKLVIPMVYDDVTGLFEDGKIKVTEDQKSFFINRAGETVLDDYKAPPYNYPSYFAYGVSAVKIWDKWAFYSEEGKMLTSFIYSDVIAFNEGLAGVKLKDKWGFIDIRGKEVIAPDYDEIVNTFEKGVAIVVKGNERYGIDKTGKRLIMDIPLDGRYGFMTEASVFPLFTNYVYDISTDKPVDWGFKDKMGKMVTPLKIVFTEGLSKVKYKGKWGFIDTKGEVVIPAELDEIITPFQNGNAVVVKNGNTYKIDGAGKTIGVVGETKPLQRKYDYEAKFSEGMAQVHINYAYGFIDENRKEVVPLVYEAAGYFYEGMAYVQQKEKWGYVNKTGQLVIPCMYESALDFKKGMACVSKGGKFGFIDKTNKVIIPFKYEEHAFFLNGIAVIKLGGKLGSIDMMGKEIAPAIYEDVKYTHDDISLGKLNGAWVDMSKPPQKLQAGIAALAPKLDYDLTKQKYDTLIAVKSYGKYGYNDKNGSMVVPPMYVYGGEFHEGFGGVLLNDKQGFIDLSGQVVIPIMYENANWFREGLVGVKSNGKWGFVNTKNKNVIQFKYEEVNFFNGGLVAVKLGGKWGFIDEADKVIIPIKYDHVSYFADGVCVVKAGGWGYINRKGEEIIATIYDDIGYFKNGKAEAKLDGKIFYFDKTGKKLSQ